MLEEATSIVATLTGSIRAGQPEYAVVPEREHRQAVAVQVRNRLQALSEQRALRATEIEAATALAAERAAQGIPIDALIAAWQAADTLIWRMIVERSTHTAAPLLPAVGTLMFDAIRETTSAMAGAHNRVARGIDGDRVALAHRFMECVEDPGQQAASAVVATRLGLDPGGTFVGLVWSPGPAGDEAVAPQTVPVLPGHLAADVVGRPVAGGRLEMVTQAERLPESIAHGPDAGSPGGLWGIGLARRGLSGAHESLGDARIAFGAASAQRPIRTFTQDWHEAVLLAERSRLDPLLAPTVEVARAHPHLAETVLAFAAADMSVAATAPAVHLHANSVTYRLHRWSQLTGMEARSFAGLSQSVVACRLAVSCPLPVRPPQHQPDAGG